MDLGGCFSRQFGKEELLTLEGWWHSSSHKSFGRFHMSSHLELPTRERPAREQLVSRWASPAVQGGLVAVTTVTLWRPL
jgi:hypothetical protein